jgi:hypothetical protein
MSKTRNAAVLLAAMGLTGAAAVASVQPEELYVHVENEKMDSGRNDTWAEREYVSVSEADRDCFFITGKLQKDCIWDRVPKCYVVAYGKPAQAFVKNEQGIPVAVVVEPIVATEAGGSLTTDVLPGADGGPGSIRLGVAALFDAEDGTINGLAEKGLHGETGQVYIEVDFDSGDDPEPYKFEFKEGREALRLAYLSDSASTATVTCINDMGMKEVAYDVDFYQLNGLRDDGESTYCLTVIGGLDYDCNETDTLLGAFDNTGLILGGLNPKIDDDGESTGNTGNSPYSELCVIANSSGVIRFAVTGSGDTDFNGLDDYGQLDYFLFLQNNGFDEDDDPTYIEDSFFPGQNYVPGASLKNSAEAGDVIRLNREDFDESGYECPPDHGIAGGYCIKVRFVPHDQEENGDDDDDGTPGGGFTAASVDFNGDGWVNGTDLATLLTFWGPIQ